MEAREKIDVKEVFSKDEVSLVDLLRLVTDRLKILYTVLVIFLAVGILIAATSPVEYEAQSQVLSEETSDSGSLSGGLGGLAGLAGISIPSSSAAQGISPAMYPSIVSSQPFLAELMEERFFFKEKNREMSLYEYYSQERPDHVFGRTFSFLRSMPRRVISIFSDSSDSGDGLENTSAPMGTTGGQTKAQMEIVSVSRSQEYVMNVLASKILIEFEGRIIIIKTLMPEAYSSAQLNNVVREKILRFVIDYKTDKARENLKFIEERTNEAEQKFKDAQLKLARFRDSNQGMVTQTARTKEEQLQAEFNLAFSLYNKLALELEQTKIQLKKETPVFTDFQPVTVPLTKALPDVLKVIVLNISLGIFLGGLFIFISIVRAYFR